MVTASPGTGGRNARLIDHSRTQIKMTVHRIGSVEVWVMSQARQSVEINGTNVTAALGWATAAAVQEGASGSAILLLLCVLSDSCT